MLHAADTTKLEKNAEELVPANLAGYATAINGMMRGMMTI